MIVTEMQPRLPRWVSFVVGITATVVLLIWIAGTPPSIAGKFEAVGYAICHRIASHSFLINGMPMPLCARCTGIYLGVMTSFLITVAAGRTRVHRLPPLRVGIFLALFVVLMGIDGVNSYIRFIPNQVGLYESHNWLRLVTGMFCGITMFHLIFPVFNGIVWRTPEYGRALNGLRELAGISAVAIVVILLVITERPVFLWLFGALSALGVVMMLTMIGVVLFLSITRMDRAITTWRDLAIPVVAGLTLAFIQLGGVDLLRYAFTGTWNGFAMGG
jgi:uncharacterized membrane protein